MTVTARALHVVVVVGGFALGACKGDGVGADAGAAGESAGGEQTQTGGDGDGDPGDGDGDGDAEIVGLELMTALGGLWTGPAIMTPLGIFDPMHMDMRAADEHVLFSRVDLEGGNSLRFAFSIETIGGKDQLVYRNGGYFMGMLRDTRTILEDHTPLDDAGVGMWRFCAVAGGCDYIDATWEFQSSTALVFDVLVKGEPHLNWVAERVQGRELPEPFPVDQGSQGAGDAPFPAMPTLEVNVSWTMPLVEPAYVWVLLSTEDCPLAGFCDYSRSIRGTADVGATNLVLMIDQVHAGAYEGNAILDRDQNLMESLFPGDGDAVSLPNQPVTIAATGTSMVGFMTFVEL